MYKIRIARKEETYLDGTMVSPLENEIILKEPEIDSELGEPIENLIEEILNHEVLHLVICKLEGDIVSSCLDRITFWIYNGKRWKLTFKVKRCKKNESGLGRNE